MGVCEHCGFDALEEGVECAVCGSRAESSETDESSQETVWMTSPRRHRGVPSEPKALFRDRYRLEAVLGTGGMGSVSRVTDLTTGRVLALKILHQAAHSIDSMQRFQREVEILRRIEHALIPRIHDSGVFDQKMYLVTDLVEGETLRSVISMRGSLPANEVSRIASIIAEGLEVAHHHGVIHRDVKPHNVILMPDGQIRLLDFGIAREVGFDAQEITASGILIGTPQYMSPEQFSGEKVDARSDIYSLGVLMFELVTGTLPFTADTAVAMGILHMQETPPPPRMVEPSVPPWLNRVILKCLEKRREDRYPTAGDLAAELNRPHGRPQYRRLRSGDLIIDSDETSEWALVIASKEEKRDWTSGATLLFDSTYYRLELAELDETLPAPYVYRFTFWPEGEAIRKLLQFHPDQLPDRDRGWKRWLERK
jgi:serine/threonine protein kinase